MRQGTWVGALALVGAALACGCASQRQFESPEAAAEALRIAAEDESGSELRAIFGPRAPELRSADRDQDRRDFASFRRAMSSSEVEFVGDEQAHLLIGEDRWPFAVPLVRKGGGWRFDTDAGVEELENRRIGRNELRTIAVCRGLVIAQEEYRAMDRDGDGELEYADRLMSSEGKKDGLSWPSPGGVDPSPIGPKLAEAAVRIDAQGRRIPYHGYFYRLLTRQSGGAPGGAKEYGSHAGLTGGWAVIAWPAEYDTSGVMSFLVCHHGEVYEADLGDYTAEAAAAIDAFDPVDPWRTAAP